MSKQYVALTAVAVVFFGVMVWAVLTGLGPAPGSSADLPKPEYENTVFIGDEGTASGADSEGEAGNESGPPFSFAVKKVTDCGTTCRDVTVTLRNNLAEDAEGVVVRTVISTGKRRIWQGSEEVGSFEAGGSVTRTQRVKLTFAEAFRVQQNGGWITITTYIHTEETTYVFKDRRRVTG